MGRLANAAASMAQVRPKMTRRQREYKMKNYCGTRCSYSVITKLMESDAEFLTIYLGIHLWIT